MTQSIILFLVIGLPMGFALYAIGLPYRTTPEGSTPEAGESSPGDSNVDTSREF